MDREIINDCKSIIRECNPKRWVYVPKEKMQEYDQAVIELENDGYFEENEKVKISIVEIKNGIIINSRDDNASIEEIEKEFDHMYGKKMKEMAKKQLREKGIR